MSPNQHIISYLDYYLDLEPSPEFAVMINAPWGTGKTFFMQQYLEKWKTENPDKKVIFISLYGLNDVTEIDDAIFQQMHPALSSKEMKLGARMVKSFLKEALKLDLDIQRKDLPDWLKNSDKNILVFDDLERSNLANINELLGYINQFNEHQNHKIILIANEEEINKKDNSYLQIKEKLIGKTFLLASDHTSAIKEFINQIKCIQTKGILQTNQSLILEFIQRYQNHNLRIIKQVLWDFERLVQALDDEFLQNQIFLTSLLESFLAICYEHKNGLLNSSNLTVQSFVAINNTRNKSEPREKHPLEKYGGQGLVWDFIRILSPVIWEEILDKSYFNTQLINQHLGETKYFTDVPLWIKLWNYRSLTDEQLITLVSEVKRNIRNQKIYSAWEILHLWGIFLTYNQAFQIICSDELSQLRTQLLDNAKKLTNPFPNYQHSLLKVSIHGILDEEESNSGYSYQSNKEQQFIDFREELEKILLTHIEKLTQIRVDDICALLSNNSNKLATQLTYEEDENFIPSHILVQVDTKKWVEKYNHLESWQQFDINSGLRARYKNRFGRYIDEKNWLHSLTVEFDLLKQSLEASPSDINNLKLYRLNLINHELKTIVTKMNEI